MTKFYTSYEYIYFLKVQFKYKVEALCHYVSQPSKSFHRKDYSLYQPIHRKHFRGEGLSFGKRMLQYV